MTASQCVVNLGGDGRGQSQPVCFPVTPTSLWSADGQLIVLVYSYYNMCCGSGRRWQGQSPPAGYLPHLSGHTNCTRPM
eukprot:14758287-Ditylum_brightwellii.AAC.1